MVSIASRRRKDGNISLLAEDMALKKGETFKKSPSL
jgi:hypothetical protein